MGIQVINDATRTAEMAQLHKAVNGSLIPGSHDGRREWTHKSCCLTPLEDCVNACPHSNLYITHEHIITMTTMMTTRTMMAMLNTMISRGHVKMVKD